MVRKIITICIALAALAAVPLSASAAEVYDGTISTTYITIFRDIASKIDFAEDYVFYRSGQYEYTMVTGEIAYENGMFSAHEAETYVLTTNNSYNSTYQYSVGSIDSWSLSPGAGLVYSSLGDYPDLIERSDKIAHITLFVLCVALCMSLLRPVFGFSQRLRR